MIPHLGEHTLQRADAALIAVGVVLDLGWLVRRIRSRDWRDALRVSADDASRFTLLDLLTSFGLMLFVASLCRELLAAPVAAASSQPGTTSVPASAEHAAIATVGLVAPLATSLFVLVLARLRTAGGVRRWVFGDCGIGRAFARAIVAYVAVWPVCVGLLLTARIILTWADPSFQPEEHETLRILRSTAGESPWLPWALVAGAGLAAPLMEELVFRGLLQSVVTRRIRSVWTGIVAASLLFGLSHLRNPETVAPMFAFGLWLGFLYARTGSLLTVVALHVVFNLKTLAWLAMGA